MPEVSACISDYNVLNIFSGFKWKRFMFSVVLHQHLCHGGLIFHFILKNWFWFDFADTQKPKLVRDDINKFFISWQNKNQLVFSVGIDYCFQYFLRCCWSINNFFPHRIQYELSRIPLLQYFKFSAKNKVIFRRKVYERCLVVCLRSQRGVNDFPPDGALYM